MKKKFNYESLDITEFLKYVYSNRKKKKKGKKKDDKQ